jgi:hypothetical protein
MSEDEKQDGKAADGQVQIRWDGSKMKSTYANVTNVSSTKEEVTILFGTNKSWHNAHKELTVELSDRMILNPFAAKRLSILLNNVVKGYEEQFGILELEMPAQEGTDGEPEQKH